jgi:DNA adenine methylase
LSESEMPSRDSSADWQLNDEAVRDCARDARTGGQEVSTMLAPIRRPALRYHGGKWRLAPWLLDFFPPHRVYAEPFGGGASVLLQKTRSYSEVYNDLDSEVVNVFRVLRDPERAARLTELLELTPYAREEFVEAYTPAEDEIEQARRTIVKSFMGYGSAAIHRVTHTAASAGFNTRISTTGFRSCEDRNPNRPIPNTGYRSNANNSGTTPAHDWMHFPVEIHKFCERLQGVVIENRPAADLIAKLDRADCLFYCDPPYPMSTRDPGADYAHEMSDEDHRALAAQLHQAAAMVVISGYHCALYDDELYADWDRRERDHVAQGAKPSVECVWINPAAQRAMRQQKLF